MPDRIYKYDCDDCHRTRSLQGDCHRCGKEGRYVGWEMNTFDRMAAFSRVTGMPPFSPARMSPEGTEIIARMVPCQACDATGLIQLQESEAWAWCPQCGGNQYALNGKFELYVNSALYDPLNGIVGWRGLDEERRCPKCGGPWFGSEMDSDVPMGLHGCPRCERGG